MILSMISVIIPTWNRYALTLEALYSVYAQKVSPLEVIVVDDGSDESHPPYSKTFPDVRELRIEHCGMAGRVRNIGVGASQGELIAFLDSDDLWLEGKLQQQSALFEKEPDVQIVHTREIWQRQGKIVSQSSQRHVRAGDLFEDSLQKCIIGPSTVMLRKSFFMSLGGFREDLEVCEDYEFWLRVTALTKVAHVDRELSCKRAGHGPQLSETYGFIERFKIDALKQLVETRWFSTHATDLHQRRAEKALAHKYVIHAQGARRRGREQEAMQYEAMAAIYASVKRQTPG